MSCICLIGIIVYLSRNIGDLIIMCVLASQHKGLPDIALNKCSIIDCDA